MTENENMPCTEEERRESGTTEAARVEAAGADNVHADNAAADHDADIPSEELDAKISSIGIDSGDEDDETVLDTIDTIEEKKDEAYVGFFKNNPDGYFVQIYGGGGMFFLGNEKSRTYCVDRSLGFEAIEDTTLTGKPNNGNFTCTRIVAVQLSN